MEPRPPPVKAHHASPVYGSEAQRSSLRPIVGNAQLNVPARRERVLATEKMTVRVMHAADQSNFSPHRGNLLAALRAGVWSQYPHRVRGYVVTT